MESAKNAVSHSYDRCLKFHFWAPLALQAVFCLCGAVAGVSYLVALKSLPMSLMFLHDYSTSISKALRDLRWRWDILEPDIIVTTLRYLCRNIRDRDAAMLALNRFRLGKIIDEILRAFPEHDGIRKWGWAVIWSLSYPKQSWRPTPLSMAVPVRSWRNIGGSWVICRRQKKSIRRNRAQQD